MRDRRACKSCERCAGVIKNNSDLLNDVADSSHKCRVIKHKECKSDEIKASFQNVQARDVHERRIALDVMARRRRRRRGATPARAAEC